MSDKENRSLAGQVVLVTGGTRGIGKAVAVEAAQAGANLVITYRDASKQARINRTQAELEALGVEVQLLQTDITSTTDRQAMFEAISQRFGRLDTLILNAAGGLEADKGPEYARLINHDAQLALVEAAMQSKLLRSGSWVIYMTSWWAHRWGKLASPPGYAPVAETKFAAEQDLRGWQTGLSEQNIKLGIVVGHVISGTGAYAIFKRKNRAMIDDLANELEGGQLPDPPAVARATLDYLAHPEWPTGHTVFVGIPRDEIPA